MAKQDKNHDERPRERGVFERPPGSGIWWVRYVDENRLLHREKVGTKALAVKVYRKRKTEIAERRFFPEQIGWRDVPLSDVIDDYLKRAKGALRSYRDYERYGRYWTDALGTKTLRQITPGDIERYVAGLDDELTPASINRQLAFLKRVFNVAIADGKAVTNPVRSVKLLKENNQRVRFLGDEEELELRKAIGEDEWPMVAVAMHTGLRQAEQFKLSWEHVDFTTGILTVPRSKHGETRRVPMNDTAREILRARKSRLKSAHVFPSETDETPIDACNYMRRVFVPAIEAAGIENFHWHDLRHTFASRLIMAGVDLRTVQELMGHKTITMTLRYSHLSPAHQLEAVQRLNRKPTDTTTDTKPDGDGGAEIPAGEVIELSGEKRSWRADSNRGPADYESAALPTELRQRAFLRAAVGCDSADPYSETALGREGRGAAVDGNPGRPVRCADHVFAPTPQGGLNAQHRPCPARRRPLGRCGGG
jgi:site-specific recombinase XerD